MRDYPLTKLTMITIFKNSKTSVEAGDDSINFYDLTDRFNDTKGFTQNKRGIKKAIMFISQLSGDERLNEDLGFYDIVKILTNFNLKPHTYCGMD